MLRSIRRCLTNATFLVIVGGVLFTASAVAGYFWFYYLAPIRRMVDPEWLTQHSRRAYWEQEQAYYRRTGGEPDLFFRRDRIGDYGDERWFLWLVEKVLGESGFHACGCHLQALALMSNHALQTEDEWRAWFAANKDKSQEEWLQAGFARLGLAVSVPPSGADTLPLLRLLGKASTNPGSTNKADNVPGSASYNAFRWLRDSGFQPMQYVATNENIFNDVLARRGVLMYARYEGRFPASEGLGSLGFASDRGPEFEGMGRPLIARRPAAFLAWSLVAIPAGLAILVWVRAWRNSRSSKTPASPGSPSSANL